MDENMHRWQKHGDLLAQQWDPVELSCSFLGYKSAVKTSESTQKA